MSADRDRFAGVSVKAVEHVAAVAGGLSLFWDLVHDMHRIAEKGMTDADAIGGFLGGWVERFDFIGNALSASNDELIEILQEARIPSVLCSGSIVLRSMLGGNHAQGSAP